MLLSSVILYQVPDKIPSHTTGIDQDDCRCPHGTTLVDRYFISERTFSQKGKGAGISTRFILTGHY